MILHPKKIPISKYKLVFIFKNFAVFIKIPYTVYPVPDWI